MAKRIILYVTMHALLLIVLTAQGIKKNENHEVLEISGEMIGSSERNISEKMDNNSTIDIVINIGEKSYPAILYENDTTKAFADMLPITVNMSELNGNEKYCYLNKSLPKNDSVPAEICMGDLMLFGSDCFVLFYENSTTSYRYTPLGKLNNSEELAEVLGTGNVEITIEMQ